MSKKLRLRLTGESPLFDTTISGRDGGAMLVRGYDLVDLAVDVPFEAMVGLLLQGELPHGDALLGVSQHIAGALLPEAVIRLVAAIDVREHPLNVALSALSASASLAQASHDKSARIRDAMTAIGLYAKALAIHMQRRRGTYVGDQPLPLVGTTYCARFLATALGLDNHRCCELLNRVLVGAAEMNGAPSVFAGRVAASTRTDVFTAICGSLAVWKGHRHGGASEWAQRQLMSLSESGLEPAEFYTREIRLGTSLFGFGSRMYTTGQGEDPRLETLAEIAHECHAQLGGSLYPTMVAALSAMKRLGKQPNPDLFLAAIGDSLGLEPDETPAVAFLGRIAGCSAHILEEYSPMRPMIAVRGEYAGQPRRALPEDARPSVSTQDA